MRTPSLRFMAPIFVAAALLAAPPARAAGWLSSPFEGIWTRLSTLWADTGCIYDPNGRCRDQAGQPKGITAETGCVIDPHGGCRGEAVQPSGIIAETGCVIDPSGSCRDGAQAPPSGLDRPRRP